MYICISIISLVTSQSGRGYRAIFIYRDTRTNNNNKVEITIV